MEKVLIVDDEYITRVGLVETIDWTSLGLEVVGSAPNGAIGLEMAREKKPDLIISDVCMPVMDGLDMAKTLFEENADVAVIVYSGHRDFEYVHRAFSSGVAGFLLKPIENKELIARVKEVMDKLHEKRQENRMLEQFVKNAPILRKQLLETLLQGSGDDSTTEHLEMLGVRLPLTGFMLCCRTQGDPEEFLNAIDKELFEFDNITESFKGYGIFITSDIDEVLLMETVNRALKDWAKKTDARFNIGIAKINNTGLAQAFIEADERSRSLLYSAINAIAFEGEGKHFKKLVRDALAIIEGEFDKSLSIRYVAEKLLVSESHLMHEFKDATGKSFNECLMEFRILKANELLLCGEMRVNEVARAVGYGDPRYFAQVFKEQTGMTPSEFILKNGNED